MQHFIPFKKYSNAALAQETQQLLEANGIACRLADNGASLDGSFGRGFTDYEIQLYRADFEKAEALLEARAAEWVDELPENYYLFSFTDEDLLEVIQKKDEWNEIDYVLAKKLLAERGKSINVADLNRLQTERLQTLAKPDDLHYGWIIAGYVFAVLGSLLFWALGMTVGIISGYFLYTSKKTLPDGSKVYSYGKNVRWHGRNIFILGIVIMVISLGYIIYLKQQ